MTESEVLAGGRLNPGMVIRIGDRFHRPRGRGADAAEAALVHLESVGFEAAPRFLGHDNEGRQVLSFLEGVVYSQTNPSWVDDDEANARMLGRIAALVRDLHDALEGFDPPSGIETFRQLPVLGTTWNHADVHYANAVFRGDVPVGFIDFDCSAPAGRMYDPATLLFCARCPRPDHGDNPRRIRAALLAVDAVLEGYEAIADERLAFHNVIAATFDHVADFMIEKGAHVFAETRSGDINEERNHRPTSTRREQRQLVRRRHAARATGEAAGSPPTDADGPTAGIAAVVVSAIGAGAPPTRRELIGHRRR